MSATEPRSTPPLSRLAEWAVPPEEIDNLGHMSITQYGRRALDGWERMLAGLGGDPAALEAAGLTATCVDQHMLYRREQLVGAPLALDGGVTGAGGSQIEFHQAFVAARTGELAATFRTSVQISDLARRRPADIPGPWLEAALAARVEAPPPARPLTLTLGRMGRELRPADFHRVGLSSHLRREITAADCDAYGFVIPPRPPVRPPKRDWSAARTGPRTTHQGVLDQVWGGVAGYVWPTLETRTLSLRAPRLGEALDSYAALVEVGEKIVVSGVWVFEAGTGALVGVTQSVNIFSNHQTRRPEVMPPAVRGRLEGLATPRLLDQGQTR